MTCEYTFVYLTMSTNGITLMKKSFTESLSLETAVKVEIINI